MNAKNAVEELEALAKKLEVTVRYNSFTGEGMGPGGLCKVKGQWRVIIDRRNSDNERLVVLARALGRFDLEDHFVSPALRELIGKYRTEES